MLRICHVSDLHLHGDNHKNQKALALIARVQSTFQAHAGDRNLLLVTGDVTDDGTVEQYTRAREALGPFRDGLRLCPGNHDYGTAGNSYKPDRALYFDDVFLPSLGLTDRYLPKLPVITRVQDGATRVVLYGLNSVFETQSMDDFARGAIGTMQLMALHAALDDPQDVGAVKLVYLHHRPQRCSWFLELVDSEELMAVVNNRVQLVAFGHSGRDKEPPEARVMEVRPVRPYGVAYLLNANSCVDSGHYYEILIDGPHIAVHLR